MSKLSPIHYENSLDPCHVCDTTVGPNSQKQKVAKNFSRSNSNIDESFIKNRFCFHRISSEINKNEKRNSMVDHGDPEALEVFVPSSIDLHRKFSNVRNSSQASKIDMALGKTFQDTHDRRFSSFRCHSTNSLNGYIPPDSSSISSSFVNSCKPSSFYYNSEIKNLRSKNLNYVRRAVSQATRENASRWVGSRSFHRASLARLLPESFISKETNLIPSPRCNSPYGGPRERSASVGNRNTVISNNSNININTHVNNNISRSIINDNLSKINIRKCLKFSSNYSSNSFEGRITMLIKNYQMHSLSKWMKQVDLIENRCKKFCFLEPQHVAFFDNIIKRNVSFMRNIEKLIDDALKQEEIVDCELIRFAFDSFKQCALLNTKIKFLVSDSSSNNYSNYNSIDFLFEKKLSKQENLIKSKQFIISPDAGATVAAKFNKKDFITEEKLIDEDTNVSVLSSLGGSKKSFSILANDWDSFINNQGKTIEDETFADLSLKTFIIDQGLRSITPKSPENFLVSITDRALSSHLKLKNTAHSSPSCSHTVVYVPQSDNNSANKIDDFNISNPTVPLITFQPDGTPSLSFYKHKVIEKEFNREVINADSFSSEYKGKTTEIKSSIIEKYLTFLEEKHQEELYKVPLERNKSQKNVIGVNPSKEISTDSTKKKEDVIIVKKPIPCKELPRYQMPQKCSSNKYNASICNSGVNNNKKLIPQIRKNPTSAFTLPFSYNDRSGQSSKKLLHIDDTEFNSYIKSLSWRNNTVAHNYKLKASDFHPNSIIPLTDAINHSERLNKNVSTDSSKKDNDKNEVNIKKNRDNSYIQLDEILDQIKEYNDENGSDGISFIPFDYECSNELDISKLNGEKSLFEKKCLMRFQSCPIIIPQHQFVTRAFKALYGEREGREKYNLWREKLRPKTYLYD